MKQNIERQIANIKSKYPDAMIFADEFTGTKIERPEFSKLLKIVKSGDVIVFDEVSRMSRNAEDGFRLYEELYNKGVELIFLKESTLNTENFRQTQQIASVGNEIADMYIDTTNKVLMILAKQQIQKAFETAQAEVEFLHQRTSEGVRRAQAEGKRVGRANGVKVTTKKSISMKADIKKLSRDFDGKNTDAEVIKLLGLARGTYYKYKREMLAD
jgi:Site-specific recombinases, DNA invertase Pin homologs